MFQPICRNVKHNKKSQIEIVSNNKVGPLQHRDVCFFDRNIKVVVTYLWLPCVAKDKVYLYTSS